MIGVLLVQAPSHRLHRILLMSHVSSTATFLVCDEPLMTTATVDTIDANTLLASACSTFNRLVDKEEPPPEPHINGDLRYLYHPPKINKRLPVRTNYRPPLRQPCWRAGRWKSLT